VIRLNGLTDPTAWENPEWLALHVELSTYSVDPHCFSATKEFAYRKGWELTQALYGAGRLGAIGRQAQALGVGVGREPVLFYLADRVRQVVGTDLYGIAGWSEPGHEADPRFLSETSRYCPRPYDASRLRLEIMDGTDLAFDDESFDFVWSLSSIEHFGGHEAARRSVREMGRVTRPGGIVCVATEYVITPGAADHPEYFTRDTFEEYVLGATPLLSPVEPMNYDLPPLEYLIDPIMVHLDRDVHRIRHHIILNDGTYQWTSALVFFRRG
jgi:SAM-dependent methyltransferase